MQWLQFGGGWREHGVLSVNCCINNMAGRIYIDIYKQKYAHTFPNAGGSRPKNRRCQRCPSSSRIVAATLDQSIDLYEHYETDESSNRLEI